MPVRTERILGTKLNLGHRVNGFSRHQTAWCTNRQEFMVNILVVCGVRLWAGYNFVYKICDDSMNMKWEQTCIPFSVLYFHCRRSKYAVQSTHKRLSTPSPQHEPHYNIKKSVVFYIDIIKDWVSPFTYHIGRQSWVPSLGEEYNAPCISRGLVRVTLLYMGLACVYIRNLYFWNPYKSQQNFLYVVNWK